MDEAIQAWLRLALAPEIGPVLARRLLAAVGDPESIFSAKQKTLLDVPGMGRGRIERLLDPAADRAARDEAARCAEAGVAIVTLADSIYPVLLRRFEFPPPVLWVRGELKPEDRLAISIVGPRRPSDYARLMAERLAPPLAAHGLTLVSGLAYGIDSIVHKSAVEAGGRTLAVVGHGLGVALYPAANAQLAESIADGHGALVSIFPMQTEPSPGLFPQRNEVLAGLGLATLVIEASPESGTLITARHAAAANRIVMACPGDAVRRAAQGSNRLLAEGAVLVQEAADVLESLGDELRRGMAELGHPTPARETVQADLFDEPAEKPAPAAAPSDPISDLILELLAAEPQPIDMLLMQCEAAGGTPGQVMEKLLTLELEGRLRQLPGRLYAACK
ncbi:DNA-protecting protein DprA [bacterium]|nr:DNA-protecting protein DprA [bacterium]